MARPRRHVARTTNERIALALAACLGVLGVLWARCLWLQVIDARRYVALGRRQHVTARMLRAPRGMIYDRAGRPLAVSVLAPSVYANARQVAAKAEVAHRLASIVGRKATMIERRLEQDRRFVWIARQVDPALVPRLAAMEDAGIGLLDEAKRLYPHGRLAGHLVGFVDIDERGLEGVERSLEGILRGEDGWSSTLHDARGRVLIGPWTVETTPVPGLDVVLTIDSVVQKVVEESLDWAVKKYHAQGGSVIVLDPSDGAIVAMANAPSYDPNAPARAKAEARRNRAVTDLFEPGSVMKIVTAAALLEEGRITPEEVLFCENGSYRTVGRHVLHDHTPHGALSFGEVITFSSNIGVAKAAQRLTPEELYRYMRLFGVAQRTGIDLPGEVNGILRPPAAWSKLSPFIIPIGQEVATTPIQLAVVTAVIASGGKRVQPYVIDRIQTAEGDIVRTPRRPDPIRVISPSTAAILQQMLVSVIESGTGRLAAVQGLTVAGKTGTAQKLEPNGRYSHSRFVASFVGFGPVPDSTHERQLPGEARFVIVVNIDEPRPAYFGGVVSAPVFKRIIERLAGYWQLERGHETEREQRVQAWEGGGADLA